MSETCSCSYMYIWSSVQLPMGGVCLHRYLGTYLPTSLEVPKAPQHLSISFRPHPDLIQTYMPFCPHGGDNSSIATSSASMHVCAGLSVFHLSDRIEDGDDWYYLHRPHVPASHAPDCNTVMAAPNNASKTLDAMMD